MIDDQLEMEFESKGQKRKKEKAQNRKVSDLTSSTISPIRRKDSVGKKDKYVNNISKLDNFEFGLTYTVFIAKDFQLFDNLIV